MHREISRADEVFGQDGNLGLYLLTALLALLIGRDLAPPIMQWLATFDLGLDLKPWSREIYGYRFALIAAVVGGARVLFHSLEALLEGRFVADLAIAIATIAAILLGEPLVAAEVVFIGLVGECLEAFTFARTQRGIRKLVEVFPQRCWVLREGQEVRVFTNEVRVGDCVVVKPGGKIPVDGVIIEGRSAVDASPLTGESLPIDRGPGDEVLAGSINQFGQLTIDAKKVAEQTVAGRVVELTARALKDKAPIERQVDRIAKWFLPAVLGTAIIVFLINLFYQAGPFRPAEMRLSLAAAARLSLYPTLSVLVVACPCALILATPAAVIAALGRLAGTGILIKGGSALERLAQVQAFAFDKTGTLTEGKLELGEVIGFNGISENEVLQAAALAEQGSEHPLGRLIVREAQARALTLEPLTEFQAHPGAGVSAIINQSRLLVGTRRLLEEQDLAVSDEVERGLQRLDEAGQTSLLVARDGMIIGIIGARDRIRPDAADVIQELRNAGIAQISLLTGDRLPVARAVAEQLKIDDIHAELLPLDKAAFVSRDAEALRSGASEARSAPQSLRVAANVPSAFVGDGINDAPALAKAAVGIAVGSATDVAAEAGDVVTMGEPLRHLPLLLRLSRETIRIIRQNIFVFAFGVNLVGVLLTGVIWPLFATSPELYDKSPLVAVLYHQLGSLLVLLNSMRLLAFERAPGKAWSRWKDRVAFFDVWMEKNLKVDQIVHGLAHQWKPILGGLLIVMLGIWLASGFIVVEPDEAAVVQHFGRVTDDLGPGLHYRWPWPIDSVRKLKPAEIKVVLIDFRPRNSSEEEDEQTSAERDMSGATWTSVHGEPNRPLGMSLFTGDRNLIDVMASVHYTIDNPRQYLYSTRQPRSVIRSAAEGALREIVAGRTFMELLSEQRLDLQRQVALRLSERLSQLEPDGIGVKIAGVVIHDMHPPLRVAREYYRLAKAIQEREQLRHRANATATLIKSRAVEDATISRNTALRDANDKIQDALSETANLLGWQQARAALDPEQEHALWKRFHRRLKSEGELWSAWIAFEKEREGLLAERQRLIDFLLTWDAVTAFWKGRDKIIIDAEQIRGRLQLYLMDPDLARPATLFPGPRGEIHNEP